jgi:hypothetical protein
MPKPALQIWGVGGVRRMMMLLQGQLDMSAQSTRGAR